MSEALTSVLIWSAETTLVASALALIAALGDRWKRLGPAARHALWLVILVKLVTPPLVHWPWSRPWSVPGPVVVEATQPAASAPDPGWLGSRPPGDAPESATPEPGGIALGARPLPPGTDSELGVDLERATPIAEPAIVAAPIDAIGVAATAFAWTWVVGSILVAAIQARRIVRFHLRARRGLAAPEWLADEVARIAALISVRAPAVRVVDGLASPMVWCLGRPVLLVPGALVKTLGRDRWRCVLAHELAHLRRGDHWVSRLELVAGVAWWWNPVYWWARRRVDAEAELACDAWVVALWPSDRITFAESLVRICSVPSLARNACPAPSVGVAGSGRDFERRLTMILNDRVSARPSTATVFAAALLAALAVPSWTMAHPAANPIAPPIAVPAAGFEPSWTVAIDDDDDDEAKAKKEKAEARAKKETAEAKAKKEKAEARAKALADRKLQAEARAKLRTEKGADAEKVEKALKDALGPDFEKKMEALGADMEKRFGPGSDFEKKMEALGKEMEKKFGPGSDFEKEMSKLGETIAKEVEAKVAAASKSAAKGEGKAKAAKAKADPRVAKAKAKSNPRAAKIRAIEARIDALTAELKKLKASEDEDDEDEEDDDEKDEAPAARR